MVRGSGRGGRERPPAEKPSWDAVASAALLHDFVNFPNEDPER
jgi:hypothetical protein